MSASLLEEVLVTVSHHLVHLSGKESKGNYATTTLLILTFRPSVHDGDIIPMLTALDLFHDDQHLPIAGDIPHNRKWKTSSIVPMGGRVIFERLGCPASGASLRPRETSSLGEMIMPSSPEDVDSYMSSLRSSWGLSSTTSTTAASRPREEVSKDIEEFLSMYEGVYGPIGSSRATTSESPAPAQTHTHQKRGEGETEIFIRVNVNDGIVAIPNCDTGPGSSCPLSEFVELVQRRGREVGDFRAVCGLPDDAEERIRFLHQR